MVEYDDGDTRYHKYLNAEMQKGEVKIEEAVATATEAGVIDEEKEEKEAEEAGTAVEAEAAAHEAGPVEAGPVGAACAENREARRTELVMGVEVEVEVEDDATTSLTLRTRWRWKSRRRWWRMRIREARTLPRTHPRCLSAHGPAR